MNVQFETDPLDLPEHQVLTTDITYKSCKAYSYKTMSTVVLDPIQFTTIYSLPVVMSVESDSEFFILYTCRLFKGCKFKGCKVEGYLKNAADVV